MTLAELDRKLAEHGQCLPFDPAAYADTTVGGLIATDAAGPLRHSAGKVRDYLLGIELVNGQGEVVRGGGKVVKNVAGYDLCKLLVGSYGTLGVIVSATFKTRPRPRRRAVLVWTFDELAAATRAVAQIEAGGIVASLAEALSEKFCRAVAVDSRAALVVGLQGAEADVEEQASALVAMSEGRATRRGDAEAEAVMSVLRDAPLPSDEQQLVAKVAVRPTQLAELLARVESEARSRELVISTVAHAGIGVARCLIEDPKGVGQMALLAEWLRLAVRDRDGAVLYEAIPESYRGRIDPWGNPGPTLTLMRGNQAGVRFAIGPEPGSVCRWAVEMDRRERSPVGEAV